MNSGFLDSVDLFIIRGDEAKSHGKSNKIHSCEDCKLRNLVETPKFPAWGEGKKGILFVLDTPSKKEDNKSVPWVGSTGEQLKDIIETQTKLNIYRDCWTVYAVRCCANKQVKATQCEACRKFLHEDIKELNPLVIVPFGYWAMIGVSGDILTTKSRGKVSADWTDYIIPDQRFQKWIIPTWDPFLLNFDGYKKDTVRIKQLVNHIKTAIAYTEKKVAQNNYANCVSIVKGPTDILALLDMFLTKAHKTKPLILALDYETTGRKPHRKGHEIISIALSDGEAAYSFLMSDMDDSAIIVFRSLLNSDFIKWRVHNDQFEYLWSYNIFGVWPKHLDQDTILGLHVLNSQKRVGLKPNVYCIFGIAGYDDSTEGFITSPAVEENNYGANSFNLMKQAPKNDMLLYNGLDALFTYRIGDYINKKIRPENVSGYNFLMESSISLVKAQENGIRVDSDGVDKTYTSITNEIAELAVKIKKLAIKNGWPKDIIFRPSASEDISKLLFDIMGFVSDKQTATGRNSTDKETLEKIKSPIVNVIADWKKAQKLRDTYVNGLKVEVIDNLMRPFFNLYTVVTFRSSSCLAKGTKIDVFDQAEKKNIENITTNDIVFSLDANNKVLRQPVIRAEKTGTKKVIRLYWSCATVMAKGSFECTPDHPIRLYDGTYVPAVDSLYEKVNSFISVGGAFITKIVDLNKIVDVYDIQVKEFSNFFADGICVHNSNFNFQNLPKRDKKANKAIRSLLYPHKDQKLAEYDYKAIEVAVGACYHKDTNMIRYINDPKSDFHFDTGVELFMYTDNPQEFSKFDRSIAKNKFVFPEFYGSYYEQTAPELWENCSPEAKQNLKKHGIKSYGKFLNHVQEIERSFWEDRFPEYTAWKKDTYAFYLKHGFVDSLTGFRYYGPMTKNEVLNIAIQGSAHHVLLRTLNKTMNYIESEGLKSKIIGQIHDSVIISVEPSEEKDIDHCIHYYGTIEIRKVWNWIIVPIAIEKSVAEIDQPWAELKELGLLGVRGKIT
jgi:uracil-DNA glycosylase family 4